MTPLIVCSVCSSQHFHSCDPPSERLRLYYERKQKRIAAERAPGAPEREVVWNSFISFVLELCDSPLSFTHGNVMYVTHGCALHL